MRGGFLFVLIAGLTPLLVFSFLVIATGLPLVEWQPPVLWTTQFGTPGVGIQNSVSVLSGDSTGVYAGGFIGFPGANITIPSPSNLFVSKYDLSGHLVWTQQFFDPDRSSINGISVGTDGLYVAGSVNLDAKSTGFVQKYDLNGREIWNNTYGQPGGEATSVSVGNGGVYAGFDYNLGSTSNIVVRSYDDNGNVVWTKSIGNFTPGSLNVYSAASRVYVEGSPYLDAGFLKSYYFNGSLDWARQFTCACYKTSLSSGQSGIYVSGNSYEGGIGSGFLTKYDPNGNQVWTRSLQASDYTSVGNVQMSADTSGIDLAITGLNTGFLMRYDSNGNQQWSFRLRQMMNAISVGQNGVYVGGYTPFVALGGVVSTNALLSEFSQSSSLIFFGLNPPYSFITVAAVSAGVGFTLWRLRRRAKRRPPRPKSTAPYGSPKPQSDEPLWRRRPP